MPIKVDFELLKDTIGLLHNGSLPTEEHFDNLLLFFDKLAESSTFAHLAHKQLSIKERPFDKLKELWDEWLWDELQSLDTSLSFERWLFTKKDKFKEVIFSMPRIQHLLSEHCGFNTTAEVKYAIQQLKNQ